MFNILVVEDDKELCGLFCKTLIKNGYNAISAQNASAALDVLEKEYIDLMISDVMMQGMSGFELVKAMRVGRMDMPILMITAKGDINDKEQGFKSGADDYMVKPIDLKEMLFRVAALLRRAKSASERKLTFGETLLEYDTQTVSDSNGSQILPLKEFQLLYMLLSYPGQIFTRQQILDDIWDLRTLRIRTLLMFT